MNTTDLILITPPFTQLNTPYPATAYLKGFLNTKEINSFQIDLGIEVILELFSGSGLDYMFSHAVNTGRIRSKNSQRIITLRKEYIRTIDAVMAFLQGSNPELARQICNDGLLPQASRFDHFNDMEWAFGTMDLADRAKHLATLYLEDLSDFIRDSVDENFGFSRYAEKLGRSANDFNEIQDQLEKAPSYIDEISLNILDHHLQVKRPRFVGFSIPFPGNLYSAFKCAQLIKGRYPSIKTVMGGGFPNTELRSLTDVRVFDYFDFITLDDGELPLELLLTDRKDERVFKRTFHKKENEVFYNNTSPLPDYKQTRIGTPDYSDLLLDRYISVIELANPMHSLWSDGRWLKLTMAHGCYWGKCTFCDISLDYIKVYEPIAAKILVDRMEQIMEQTGESGFHFVDEAAPPALMREVAMEIIGRKLKVTWWTNIRFEKSFTRDLCILLAASGCIAVSGGLEVASDRLLNLIQKGVSVEQVARVTANFTDSGIMVHSYLMYGYPTQTTQETIDSLEMVRQMFELGIIQSGFWHQFALTAHSPIGMDPESYGITPHHKDISFADNDIEFTDKTGIDHTQFSFGLKKSLYNFMHGAGFDLPLQDWFDFEIPSTLIESDHIEHCILQQDPRPTKPTARIVWLGSSPSVTQFTQSVEGADTSFFRLTFHNTADSLEVTMEQPQAEWLLECLEMASVYNNSICTLGNVKTDFEHRFENFELFWLSKPMGALRNFGLLAL